MRRAALLVALAGCTPPDDVMWFSGPARTTSPDGADVYADTVSWVRRERFPAEGRIVETVSQGADTFVTTLASDDDVSFAASDDRGSFDGTVTFEDPWADTSTWTYGIGLTDGSGTLVGDGALDADGIHTAKRFLDPDGDDVAHLTDELAPIDEAAYDAGIAAL